MEYYQGVIRVEGIVLGVDDHSGALIVYTKKGLRGKNIELWINTYVRRVEAGVVERTINGKPTFAAIFPELSAGNHSVYHKEGGKIKQRAKVTIFPGQVAEIDWR